MTRIELLNYNLDMMLEHDDYDPYAEAEEEVSGGIWGHFKDNKVKYIVGLLIAAWGFRFRRHIRAGFNNLAGRKVPAHNTTLKNAMDDILSQNPKLKNTFDDTLRAANLNARTRMDDLMYLAKQGDKTKLKAELDPIFQNTMRVVKERKSKFDAQGSEGKKLYDYILGALKIAKEEFPKVIDKAKNTDDIIDALESIAL